MGPVAIAGAHWRPTGRCPLHPRIQCQLRGEFEPLRGGSPALLSRPHRTAAICHWQWHLGIFRCALDAGVSGGSVLPAPLPRLGSNGIYASAGGIGMVWTSQHRSPRRCGLQGWPGSQPVLANQATQHGGGGVDGYVGRVAEALGRTPRTLYGAAGRFAGLVPPHLCHQQVGTLLPAVVCIGGRRLAGD